MPTPVLFLVALLLDVVICSPLKPPLPIVDLVISNKIVSPDGFERSAVLAGGSLPGTVITGNKGDIFQVNVINNLEDEHMLTSTSIHWHGIHQSHSVWADGVSSVTQCPITSGKSFLYQFKATNPGTFWYHSHYSTQYCDGLRGALIIYDPDEALKHFYDFDDESTIITLSDWYHLPAKVALPEGELPPVADAILINGRGRTPGGPKTPLSVINVIRGKRYRFRLISMSCDPNFQFSIDSHELIVIEADSIPIKPKTVTIIPIFAGQRYSFVIHADRALGNYWIRANPNAVRAQDGFEGGINSAILRYKGTPEDEPTSEFWPDYFRYRLSEADLHPLHPKEVPGKPFPGGADVVINLATDFSFITDFFTMNNATFKVPSVPVLLQILSGAGNALSLLPPGDVITLPPNKVIEISIPGTIEDKGGPHPFHLHGHDFFVVKSARTDKYNFIDPIYRDTTDTGFLDSNTTIRFVTDNAGPWIFHCHIDWHLEMGLAMVFIEDTPEIEKENHVPVSWASLCQNENDSVRGSRLLDDGSSVYQGDHGR